MQILQENEFSLNICYMRANAAGLYQDGLSYATANSAGLDLRACIDTKILEVAAGERVLIPTGIGISPNRKDVAGFVYARSGLGAKEGLTVAQGVGVIDSDYRGEIFIYLLNTSQIKQSIECGQRIAQIVYMPILQARVQIVPSLDSTSRGSGGFGHSGKI